MPNARIVNGLSTELDVRKLIDRWGVPEIGTEIGYREIAEVIGCQYPRKRWWTVVHAWRGSLMSQHNVCVAPHPGMPDDAQVFLALDARQRLQRSIRQRRGGVRKVYRATVLLTRTERGMLPPEDAAVYDHEADRMARIMLASKQHGFKPKAPKAVGAGAEK